MAGNPNKNYAKQPAPEEVEFATNDDFVWDPENQETKDLMTEIDEEIRRIAPIAFGSSGKLRVRGSKRNC